MAKPRKEESDENQDLFGPLVKITKSVWDSYRGMFFGFFFISILAGLFSVAAPKVLQQIIDSIISNSVTSNAFGILVVLYGGLLLANAGLSFLAQKINFYVSTQTEDMWRFSALRHYYDLHLGWHDKHDSGEVANRIDRGGSAIFVIMQELFGHRIIISFITLILVLSYTFWKYPSFGWLLLLPLPFYLAFSYLISKKLVEGQAKLNKLDRKASTALYDGIGNYRSVKAFGKESEETKNYSTKWSAYHKFEYGVEKIWFAQDFFKVAIQAAMAVVVLGYGAYSAYRGDITVGEVILLWSYQQMTFIPMDYLNMVFIRLKRNLKRAAHIFEIISEEDLLKDNPGAVSVGPLRQEVSLEDVNFEYRGGNSAALNNISLKIPAGKTTALVGKSGSGKTTLALLLMRFYDPSKGRILFDGQDMKHIKRSDFRKNVAWIPQDTSLFNRSIRENIAYAKPNASLNEVIEAAKLAHAHEFIMKTPDGYDSVIGERGVKLSGGQRQRIAIARALLAKPSLLIMDEATSSLDSETEHAIKESIKRLHHKTTLVIIAHRLSTILHADQIVVMDKGHVLDVKKHDELIKSNSIYQALYRLQFHKGK